MGQVPTEAAHRALCCNSQYLLKIPLIDEPLGALIEVIYVNSNTILKFVLDVNPCAPDV